MVAGRSLFWTIVNSVSCAIIVSCVQIDDACCDTETIDLANQNELHKALQALRDTRFFKIFQLNINGNCQFWNQEELCHSPTCNVCECDDDDVPELWKTGDDLVTQLPQFDKWEEHDDSWIVQDAGNMTYINLVLNPEGYTGYGGEGARKVWQAMYGQNCFPDEFSKMCYERRVFFRLLSGLQSCISAHVAYNHPLGNGLHWGPDPVAFHRMLGIFPNRIQNLYFVFVFLLRAVNKMAPYLLEYEYRTGSEPAQVADDLETSALVKNLIHSPMVQACSPDRSFNETIMFKDLHSNFSMIEMKARFRNISLITDCIDCTKCRLHGKLQVLGIGTALKILFSDATELSRNEVIALFNALGKFSHAIWITNEMANLYKLSWSSIFIFIIVLTLVFLSCWCICLRIVILQASKRKAQHEKAE